MFACRRRGVLKARLDDTGIAPCRSSSHPIPCMCMACAWHVHGMPSFVSADDPAPRGTPLRLVSPKTGVGKHLDYRNRTGPHDVEPVGLPRHGAARPIRRRAALGVTAVGEGGFCCRSRCAGLAKLRFNIGLRVLRRTEAPGRRPGLLAAAACPVPRRGRPDAGDLAWLRMVHNLGSAWPVFRAWPPSCDQRPARPVSGRICGDVAAGPNCISSICGPPFAVLAGFCPGAGPPGP